MDTYLDLFLLVMQSFLSAAVHVTQDGTEPTYSNLNHSCWFCSPGTSKVPSRCSTYNAGHTTRITLAGYAVLAPLQHVLTAVHAMQVTPLESLLLVNAFLAPL